MRRIIGILMAVMITGVAIVGCTSQNGGDGGNANAGGNQLKDGAALKDIVSKVEEEIGIAMGSDVDDTMLSDMFYINKDDVEEYAGKLSMVMVSADNFIAVKAKEGKINDVKEALEKRKDAVMQQFEQYLPDQYVKAQSGKVLVKGDYAFLIILGDTMTDDDSEFDTAKADEIVKKAEDIINGYFK